MHRQQQKLLDTTYETKNVEKSNNYQSDGPDTDENYSNDTKNVNNLSNDVGKTEMESE